MTMYEVLRPSDGKPVAIYGSYTEAALYVMFNAPDATIKTVRVPAPEVAR